MKTALEWYEAACEVLGEPELALEYANKVLELEPNFAQAYYIKGTALNDLGQKQEALNSFDKAISLDSYMSQAYYGKGNVLADLKKTKEALECLEVAIKLDPNMTYAYYVKGNVLAELNRAAEALECFNKVISLDPNFSQAYYTKGNALVELRRPEEAMVCFDKGISIDPNFAPNYYVKGNCLAGQDKYEEAIEYFDKAISLDPTLVQPYYTKGNTLVALMRTEEAIANFDKALSLDPKYNQAYYTKGNALVDLGRTEEAYGFFTKGIELDTTNALYYCGRARCLTSLGRQKEALKDFARAQELLKSGIVSSILQEEHIRYVEETLKSIVELQTISNEAEEHVKKLEAQKDNPAAQKFVSKMQALMEQKNKIAGKIVGQFGKDDNSETQKDQDELAKLKKMFQDEMQAMKAELNDLKNTVNELKNDMNSVKEELSTKLDDYKAKLDIVFAKLDLVDQDKTKLRDYYRAFLETFSSAYVTAQVVDSEQVSLDTESTAVTILSMVASYAPFIGSTLSSGVKSVGEFLKAKEMITSARKMKGLAADSTELSQLIGKSGYEIVLNPEKQKKILQVSDTELEGHSANLLGKVREFCEKMSEQVDEYLYTRLYKTPAARLGHMDANTLIELWVKDQISPYNTQKLFVEKIVESQDTSQSSSVPPFNHKASQGDKEKLCNCSMF